MTLTLTLTLSILAAAPGSKDTTSQTIAVVRQVIPRGARVDTDRVELMPRDGVKLARHVRPHLWQPAERLRARRNLRVGAVIKAFDVEPMPDVAMNDPVIVELRRGNLRVTAQAIAKEDGFAGGTIWVQSDTGRRRLRVRVIEAGRVELLALFGRHR